ncbi:MAG: hypothetical protein VKK04_01175 [Synechococcales bacterium]|nr:hypothetical protein [Synechococcales bacterium]
MKPADLLARARQGDAQAIAHLLQRSLTSQGLTVTATQDQQGCLEITLEGERVPDQAVLMGLIRRGLGRLQVANLAVVRVHAVQPGFDWFAWSEEVELEGRSPTDQPLDSALSADTPPPCDRSQSDFHRQGTPTRPPSTVPHRPSPSPPSRRTPQRDLGLLFLETFNPFKLALVVWLALHTVFGSPHYTIQGFLNNRDSLMMFLHGVNLIFHEAGHVFFAIFGRFLMILGGSLFQIMVPAGLCAYFWLTRQRFASAIALWWTGQNFLDVSIYVRDARDRELPLIGGLDETFHDWHNILLQLGLMRWDDLIANHVYGIGIGIYLVALGLAGFYARRSAEKLSADRTNPSG